MNNEERIIELENKIRDLEDKINKGSFSNLKVFDTQVQFKREVGFFGKQPIIQQNTINDPSGGTIIDSEARTAINSILDVLDAYGFTA